MQVYLENFYKKQIPAQGQIQVSAKFDNLLLSYGPSQESNSSSSFAQYPARVRFY